MRRALWIAVAACSLIAGGRATCQTTYGYTPQGQPVHRIAASGRRVVVLFFLATDCPISNRYAPEIQRLQREFADEPVALWLVYPNATETADGVIRHQAAFGAGGATLLRPSAELMALAHPSVTPEAAVLVRLESGLKVVYSGRIDNRYVDIGRERPRATRHDLEDAIAAALAKRPVSPPGGPPVGCGIVTQAALGKP